MEIFITILVSLSQLGVMDTLSDIPGIPGVPDERQNMKVKISRGSGMGWIHPGYAILTLFAFAFFMFVFWLIVVYKRKRESVKSDVALFCPGVADGLNY